MQEGGGTQVNAEEFLKKYLGLDGAPTKRQHKHQSGKASRRQARGYQTLAAVGGMSSNLKASLAPADTKLCRVVTRTINAVDIQIRPINNNLNPNSVCNGVEGTGDEVQSM